MSTAGRVEQVDRGIWATHGEIRVGPGVIFPATSHIVRLKSQGLMVHSPIYFDEDTVARVRKLGDVSVIFAPNLFHKSYLERAHQQFPEAQLVAPLSMAEKMPHLEFSELAGKSPSSVLGADFEHVFVDGAPTINEVVLRHIETNSLLVADYFFNISKVRGLLTKLVLKVVSDAFGQATQSRLWRQVTKDKAAAKMSAEAVLGLEFQRILVCHGAPIENGREVARRSLAWLTE